jgi:hypothetical protein
VAAGMSACGLFYMRAWKKGTKMDLQSADFGYLRNLENSLSELRHDMESMLPTFLDAFAFVGCKDKHERKIFKDDFWRLIGQIIEAENVIYQELEEGSNWVACPACHGEGGNYYQDWETCTWCMGHGKIRPKER